MESSLMANYVNNLIILNGQKFNMAKLAAISETSVFDFNKIMPTPASLPENLTTGHIVSFGHYLLSLELDIAQLETLLLPIEDHINVVHILDISKEYENVIKTRYSKDGKLIDENLIHSYPMTVKELESLGKSVYDNLVEHKKITAYDWRGEHWNNKNLAESVNSTSNKISFYTRWSSPFPVIEKWAKDHQLSLTYKVFEGGCFWWYVAEFVDGELISKRQSDRTDFRPLLKELYGYSDEEIEENYVTE